MLIGMRNAMMAGKKASGGYWGLCFTAEEANSTIAMAKTGTPQEVSLVTSPDGKTWTPFIVGETTITLANVGNKVYFAAGAGGNTAFASSNSVYNSFVMTGSVAASGDATSLLDGQSPVSSLSARFTFLRLFLNCTSLTAAPDLPSTTLVNNCYQAMFNGCSALRTAQKCLPAVNGMTNCYSNMFNGCRSLVVAPEISITIPATAGGEFINMFRDCSSLNYIKISCTSWKSLSFSNWVYGVSSSGTFICPDTFPHSSSDFGTSKIPNGWTVITTEAA